MIGKFLYFSALGLSLCGQPVAASWMPNEVMGMEAEDASYRDGRAALDSGQWDRAIAAFSKSIAQKSSAADGALYWKAYAENRSGRKQDALATVAALRREYPKSHWQDDARALEVEIRGQSGAPVNPNVETNDDLKLMALNSLMTSEPKQALTILEHILKTSNSPKLKERALFILTQNPEPGARKVLLDTARGTSNTDLQKAAIRYVGMTGNEEAKGELLSVYQSSGDQAVKKSVLQSLMISGSRPALMKIAQTEKNPDLQKQAIRQLALTGGQDELWQLYRTDSDLGEKKEILKSLFMTGQADRLVEVVRSEKDPQLRAAALQSLGLIQGKNQGDAIVSAYRSDSDPKVREAALNALFLQQDAKSLIALAKSETDPAMKRKIFDKLALVHSKESSDYMMEILK